MALATGQITIIDLNDSASLQGYLTSSAPKTQLLAIDGTTYTPSWSTTPITITADLYKLGSTDNIITDTNLVTDIRWFYKLSGETVFTAIVSGSGNYTISGNKTVLTIGANKMTSAAPGIDIKCEVDYKHSAALPILTYQMDITYSLSKVGATGAAGANAKTIRLTADGYVFNKSAANAITGPDYIKLTVAKQNTTNSVTWSTSPAVTLYTASTGGSTTTTGDTVYMRKADYGTTNTAVIVTATVTDGTTLTDTATIVSLREGVSGITVINPNDSVTLPASSDGTVSSYTNSGTTFQVYEGSTALTYVTSGPVAGQFTIGTPTQAPAATLTVGAFSGTGTTTAIVAAHSAMVVGTNSVNITYPLTIKRADGTTVTQNITQTVVKSKAGVDPVLAYVWASGGSNIFKNILSVSNSNTLTATFEIFQGGVSKTGSTTCKWYVQDPTVKSVNTTVAASPTPTTTVFGVASATNIVVGQELKIATQYGIVKSINGTTITLETALSTAPVAAQAVTCAGYTAAIGDGWYDLNNYGASRTAGSITLYSGANTATLTINAEFVNSLEVLKCIGTYTPPGGSATTYSDTITFIDIMDACQLSIASTGGDTFKNGVGNSILTCKVIQNGAEIDISGQGSLVYSWSKFDKNSAPEAFTPTPATMGNVNTGGTSTTTLIYCDVNAWNAFEIGSKIIVGAETVRTVSAKSSGSPYTLTVGSALSGVPANGTAIKDGSYKRIYVDDTNVIEKATFFCDIN